MAISLTKIPGVKKTTKTEAPAPEPKKGKDKSSKKDVRDKNILDVTTEDVKPSKKEKTKEEPAPKKAKERDADAPTIKADDKAAAEAFVDGPLAEVGKLALQAFTLRGEKDERRTKHGVKLFEAVVELFAHCNLTLANPDGEEDYTVNGIAKKVKHAQKVKAGQKK